MSWARALWLLVPLVGVAELAGQLVFSRRAPEPADWAAARAPLAELRRHGELVVVAPEWASPLARQAFGEELLPFRDLTRPDSTAYRRAIEVSVLGARTSELADWRTLSESSSGPFHYRVLENPSPAEVRFDFVAELEEAEVLAGAEACAWTERGRVQTGGLPGPPTFPARRFQCGGGAQFFAGVTVIDDERYRARRCVWAHPTPTGPLRLRFRDVPLGASIRGYAGLPWLIFRDDPGAPVVLEVQIAGKPIGRHVQRGGDGWSRFELPTGRAGGRGDVDFVVSASNVKDRHFCFYADTR